MTMRNDWCILHFIYVYALLINSLSTSVDKISCGLAPAIIRSLEIRPIGRRDGVVLYPIGQDYFLIHRRQTPNRFIDRSLDIRLLEECQDGVCESVSGMAKQWKPKQEHPELHLPWNLKLFSVQISK